MIIRGFLLDGVDDAGDDELGRLDGDRAGPRPHVPRHRAGLQHLCFLVASRDIVREAHLWAQARHAEIVHEPREFPEYGQHYATFWLDPHGFMLEAFCHLPEET